MNGIITKLTSAIVVLLLLLGCQQNKEKVYYVSLDGKAGNSGTLESPFPTLHDALRAIRAKEISQQAITVYIREGVYHLTEELLFTENEIGTKEHPITWKSYPNEQVLITGGVKLDQFEPINDQKILDRIDTRYHDQIYQIDLKPYNITDYGEIDPRSGNRIELFQNQQFMTIARYPNEEWLTISSVPQSGDQVYVRETDRIRYGIPVGQHYGKFTYDTDRPMSWKEDDNIWMLGYWVWDWSDEFQRVDSIDKTQKVIYPAEPYHRYGYHERQRFYFLNILEELDQPGEWYLDQHTEVLYFWPRESLSGSEVWLSVLNQPLIHTQNASHLRFENISFSASRGEAFQINEGSHVFVGGCTFYNMGKEPIIVNGGKYHRIQGCDMYELAMGGVQLNGGNRATLDSANHIATNNHIHHFSYRVKTYRPALQVGGVGNILSHNLIHDAPHMAIGFGGNDHLIEFNEIYRVLTETSDAGAIYNGRDWTERGTIIQYNYFHDLGLSLSGEGFHGVMGVYLDDCLPGTLIKGNIFESINRGIMLGGGQYNTVENNIFINCDIAIHVDARANGWAQKYAVKGGGWEMYEKLAEVDYQNPPWSTRYPELTDILDNPYDPVGVSIRNNISKGKLWLDMKEGTDFELIEVKQNLVADSKLIQWDASESEGAEMNSTDDQGVIRILEKLQNQIFDSEEVQLGVVDRSLVLPQTMNIPFDSIPIHEIGLQQDSFRHALPIL